MQRDQDQIEAAGADLVVIGMGTPAHAQDFRKEMGFGGPRLLLSRDKAAYEAMDLERASTARVYHPGSVGSGLARGVGLMRQGKRGVRTPRQDWHQLGGAFVVAPGGDVAWAHRSRHPGDLPAHDELIAAVRNAAQ